MTTKTKAKPKPAPAITLPTNNGCEPFATNVPRLQKERWNLPTAGYQPLTMRDLPQPVLRPGALDHERHGSRQPDGSVKPYARPVCAPCYRQPQALQPRYSNN